MVEHKFLKNTLTGLAKLQVDLEKQDGRSDNGQCSEQILQFQDGILRSFGLPSTPDNEKLVWFSLLPTETELDERIQQLYQKATEYLLRSVKTDLQTLIEAQSQKKDPFDVLPELKITTHTYTIFVYNEILLKEKDTAENVLSELRLANHSGVLEAIGNLEQGNIENPKELIQLLKEKGLNYLDGFFSITTKRTETKNSSELIRFFNEINGKGEFSNEEELFNSLTNCLMNYLCLVVGKTAYRITECEIYYMDIEHPDPYVHCGDEQLTAEKLYFNKAGGVDITFGNPDYPAWGGILIRGIRNIKTNQYINKNTEITGEIFKSLGDIILHDNSIFLSELEPGQIKVEQPIRSTRIGLVKKEFDDENFIDKQYRYIVELCPNHNFKDKEKVVAQLLSEVKISADDAKNILGYNKKQ